MRLFSHPEISINLMEINNVRGNRKSSLGSLANNNVRNQIKQLVKNEIKSNQELRSFDTGVATTFDNTGSLVKLTTIPQGDTDSSRQGDHVKLHSIRMKGAVTYSDTTNTFRLIILRWNQDDSSSAPVVGDITQSLTPYSPIHRDNERAKKFDVISDELLGVANVGPGIVTFNWEKQMKSIIAFQATATTGTGHLYAYIISDSAGLPHPSMSFVFRSYYTDS